MKTIIAGTLLAAAVCFGSFAAEKTETIKVAGWHCADCSAKTQSALTGIKGVKSASADKSKNSVSVTYDDSKVKRADLDKVIADNGFTAEK